MIENRATSAYEQAKAEENIEKRQVGTVRVEYSDDPEENEEYGLGFVIRVQEDNLFILDPLLSHNGTILQGVLDALSDRGIDVQQTDGRYVALVEDDFSPEDIVIDER